MTESIPTGYLSTEFYEPPRPLVGIEKVAPRDRSRAEILKQSVIA